ncbi:hypothetical protein PDM28_18945 [Stenotrophomonas aracearum]|uniref:Toxin n=1 Tax=Stenotrophomonas aracearum TaxID=3003272 RepID=A0ABY9YDK7_9GAMM|nr:hypothetical protein [Stenotrophomonas sp. A5588]WNH48706.1 hypothetical protein PDM28_18945 [Stenotrophomonas sp. A5588]
MPSLDRAALLLSTLDRHTATPNAPAAQDADSIRPDHVGNATLPSTLATETLARVLSDREADVRGRIRAAYPPESWKVADIMDRHLAAATTQAERDAVTAHMEKALAARDHEINVVRDLGLNVLGTVLDRAAWSTLLAALPSWANNAMSAGQVARAAFSGSWSSLAGVLPSLAAVLPSLRSHAEFDALLQSLPESVRTGLASLHDSISETDAQLRPNLAGGHLLSALAVAALLWQVQRALPPPSRQLQGIGRFVAELPNHWQRIAVLNGVGGALLEPVASAQGADLAAPKVPLTPAQKLERIAHQKAVDRREAIIPPWDVANVGQEVWQAPGLPHSGGGVATPFASEGAAAESDAAASPAARPQVGWIPWLGAGLTALGQWGRGGFQPVPQGPPSIEMTDMGAVPLQEVTASTPLVTAPVQVGAGATAAATTRSAPGLRRGLLYGAVAGSLGGLGAAAWGLKQWLWPAVPAAATTTEVASQLANAPVELPDGNWGTALDLVLGDIEPAARSGRTRRAASASPAAPTPPHRNYAAQLQGVTAAQLDALRDDPELLQQVQSMRRWSVAMAHDIATRPGWEWVAKLPTTEQELLVGQWQALRGLRPALSAVQDSAGASMRAALRTAGWQGDWQDIEVRLPSARVAGMAVDDRLPLLEFCLARDAQGTPVFLRNGTPVSTPERAQLTRFVRSAEARRLRGDINARVEQLRPALGRAVQARLAIDALKAKAHGALGSGNAHRRGADVVLGFLQGTSAVERATLTYTDRLPNGTPISVQVPNYLVLRSAGEPGLRGQVVLYRSDLASFQAFGDEGAFRQFLDAQRARIGMFAANGRIDGTLAGDIVQAAMPAQRAALRERVQSWESRWSHYQSGDRSAKAWNPADSFRLDFAPVDTPAGERQAWADALVVHGQGLAQQQLDRNLLRWSPLGIANVNAENAYRLQQDTALQSLRQHAHDSVCDAMTGALRMAGLQGSLDGFDPDRVRLRVGVHEMALTDWATSGWQRHGLRRPSMPANLPDWSPDAAGMPEARLEPAPWLDDRTLDAMQLVAYQAGAYGTPDIDASLGAQLQDPALRRALCGVLEDYADSNALADAYIEHLQALPHSADGNAFAGALADQLRARTGWMIEVAYQNGAIDVATRTALKAAHARLDPDGARPSSLQAVTLKDHALVGLWAIRSTAGTYVFLPDTAQGDRLLDARAFGQWLRQPGAEAYIRARAQYRHHPDLAAMFAHTSASYAIPVGFAATQGPDAAAEALIAARVDDVDEMTVSQLERFADTFTLMGAVGVGALCSLASGGTATLLCLAGTLGLVGRSIEEGFEQFERGDRDAALMALAEALYDGIDFAQVNRIRELLYQVGRRSLDTVADAADALRHWRLQSRAFAADGTLGTAWVQPRATLEQAPMLSRPLPDGGTLYLQQGREYLQRNGEFVESYVDGNGVRRLRDRSDGDAAGAPVHFKDGQWRRMQQRAAVRVTTTPLPSPTKPDWIKRVPEAEVLSPNKLDQLEAVFGFMTLKQRPDTDLLQTVREMTMTARIQQLCDSPDSLGLPGDEAMVLRAWADTPALGNGRSVETYTEDFGDWTRVARFGMGPVGLHVRTEDARTLPSLEALVDAADELALIDRLGLAEDASRPELMAAVRRELGRTIAAAPAQSLQTWQRWAAMQHRLPAAADNLVKHYPELTRAEAEALVSSDRVLKQHAEAWLFPQRTASKVAEVLGNRSRRRQREAVVGGRIRSLSEVQELGAHLQDVLPERVWTVTADTATDAVMLVFRRQSQEGVVGQLAFGADGHPYIPGGSGARGDIKSWQEGVFSQLTATERNALSDPSALRRAVVNHMKRTPLMRVCSMPRSPGGRVKRGVDGCDPPASVSLSPEEVATRDAVNARLFQVHTRAEQEYAGIRDLQNELEALRLEKRALQAQGLELPDAKLARVAELGGKDLMHERNFRLKNFVAYDLQDLRLNGEPVVLQNFPSQGVAYSGPPVAWMSSPDYVGSTPIRRVFVADELVEKSYKGKGKQRTAAPIPPIDRFRTDYAMGADLLTTSSERARSSGLVTLTDDDLRARVGPNGADGAPGWVRLADLADAQLEALPRHALPETLQKLLGDARFLPSNVRDLEPGNYRVFEIRSCSEGKALDSWFAALIAAKPELAAPLRAASNTPVEGLSGEMVMISDMHPCATSCDRRLTALTNVLKQVKLRVFFHFLDNPERTEWRLNLMITRELERTRPQWKATESELEAARASIRAALLDKAHPQRREAAEADLLHHPPVASDLPVPRLWMPTAEEVEIF